MRRFKVYIDGVLLTNTPSGIDTGLERRVVRDEDFIGIAVEEIFNLTFTGDGYCILKRMVEDFSPCTAAILIEQSCRGGKYETLYSGISDLSDAEVFISLQQVKLKLTGDSFLERIFKNREVEYSPQSQKALGSDVVITPVSSTNILFHDIFGGGPAEYDNIPVFKAKDLLQGLLNFLTGNQLTLVSDFLDRQYSGDDLYSAYVYTLDFSVAPTSGSTTTFDMTTFWGDTQVNIISGNGTAPSHLINIADFFMDFVGGDMSIEEDRRAAMLSSSFLWFQRYDVPAITQLKFWSYVPIKINSITTTVGTVTVTETPPVRSGYNLTFLTGLMLRKGGEFNFKISFKRIMDELYKLFNVQFLITGNTFRLEEAEYFETFTPMLTLGTIKDVSRKQSTGIYSTVKAGNSGILEFLFAESEYQTNDCGFSSELEVIPDSLRGDFDIFQVIDSQTDPNKPNTSNDNDLFVVQGNSFGALVNAKVFSYFVRDSGGVETLYYYNMNTIHPRQSIYFSRKFKGDYTLEPLGTIQNLRPALYLYEDTLTTSITLDQYSDILDNNLSEIKYISEGINFYGLVQELIYNDVTGKAEFLMYSRK